MEQNMKDSGKMICKTEKALRAGKMEAAMRVVTKKA